MLLVALTTPSNLVGQDENSQPQEKSASELRLEYARLNLRLVETELQLAQQYNRELSSKIPPGTSAAQRQKMIKMMQVPATAIARLNSNIEIGKLQLAEAESPSTGSPEKIRKQYAEEKVQLAKINLDAARANKAAGVPVRDLEIARLKLIYELAQLKLELIGSPENVLTLVDSLQRQIDRLSEEMLSQDQRITALEERLIEPR
jgi:hypothetical protein